jgi:NAD(P)-dependent dehydrogenase (short-subunit alcohol dehydrogenase family)
MTTDDFPRVALVTGGSSGIGRAIAALLVKEGFDVYVVARRREPLNATVAELADGKRHVEAISADLRYNEEIERVVSRVSAGSGRLDFLVNSAGMAIRSELTGMQARHVALLTEVNLMSVMQMCRAAGDLIRATARRTGSADVVNIASYVGAQPAAGLAVYSAAKAGVMAFSRAVNQEWGRDGVRSCTLCPGYVDTPLLSGEQQNVSEAGLIPVSDVVEVVRMLLRLSAQCVIPDVVMVRKGLRP